MIILFLLAPLERAFGPVPSQNTPGPAPVCTTASREHLCGSSSVAIALTIDPIDNLCDCKYNARLRCAEKINYHLSVDEALNDNVYDENLGPNGHCSWDFDPTRRQGAKCMAYTSCAPPETCNIDLVSETCSEEPSHQICDGILSHCDCEILAEKHKSRWGTVWAYNQSSQCCNFYYEDLTANVCTRIPSTTIKMPNATSTTTSSATNRSPYVWAYNATRPGSTPTPPAHESTICTTGHVHELLQEGWLVTKQKCDTEDYFAISQTGDQYVNKAFGCGCHFKAIELNASSWDRDDIHGICRFFDYTCTKVADDDWQAGDINSVVSYCSEPCTTGTDLSHSQCGMLDNFIALNGSNYGIYGCVQAFVEHNGNTLYEHIWFGEGNTSSPFPIGEKIFRDGTNLTLISALHACETTECPTTTSTTSTETTVTAIACTDADVQTLVDEGWALKKFCLQRTGIRVHS